MSGVSSGSEPVQSYAVWDRTTRWFHWINFLCVLGLIGAGLVILNAKGLGVSGEGKIALKTVHAYIGYVFVINLIWRLIWGFLGNPYARWRAVVPFGKGYGRALGGYIRALRAGEPPPYKGHNPLARIMVSFLFLLLSLQAGTGLLLAGTDLYLPPFGHEIAEWVTGSGEDHAGLKDLKPGTREGLDPEAYAQMRAFRKPFITVHVYTFYLLLASIILHVGAVIVLEIKERNALVSAMFSGRKVFSSKPVD